MKRYNKTPAGRTSQKKASRKSQLRLRFEFPEKALFYYAKQRAKDKGLEFSIAESDIKIPKLCPVLGLELRLSIGRVNDFSPTLDRINSSLGYVVANIAVISWRANRIKCDASVDEIRNVLKYMESYETRNTL